MRRRAGTFPATQQPREVALPREEASRRREHAQRAGGPDRSVQRARWPAVRNAEMWTTGAPCLHRPGCATRRARARRPTAVACSWPGGTLHAAQNVTALRIASRVSIYASMASQQHVASVGTPPSEQRCVACVAVQSSWRGRGRARCALPRTPAAHGCPSAAEAEGHRRRCRAPSACLTQRRQPVSNPGPPSRFATSAARPRSRHARTHARTSVRTFKYI